MTKSERDANDIKKDISRCMQGDLAKHPKSFIILTQLVRKLNRVDTIAKL